MALRAQSGGALEAAAAQARAAIHDQDSETLRALLAEHPALISWHGEHGETLLDATTSYALDCSDPERERLYNRPDAAEILIEAGAKVERSTWEHVIATGASGMLRLFARKNALPPTLSPLAALGDEEGVRARIDALRESGNTGGAEERIEVGQGLKSACRFGHTGVAERLLERAIELDPDLGRRIDRRQGRRAFVEFLAQRPASHWSAGPTEEPETTPWEAFVIRQLTGALDADDLPAFRRWLREEPWVLEPSSIPLQVAMIERASWQSREPFLAELLEHEPALLRAAAPPPTSALVFAIEYGNAHLLPTLIRLWPLPEDLPHQAGTGDAAGVARWFDSEGRPALGKLAQHYPSQDARRGASDLAWGPVTGQQVLDVALAWACMNHHFEVASFLLERGADIDTNWSTHEPASILHESAIRGDEGAVKFLFANGANPTIQDHRYQATAEGWARYAGGQERIADLLAAAAPR